MTNQQRLEIALRARIQERYPTGCAVRMEMKDSQSMMSFTMLEVILSVPGQVRVVPVNKRQLMAIPASLEEICDEVLFAIFLLLDEHEDLDD